MNQPKPTRYAIGLSDGSMLSPVEVVGPSALAFMPGDTFTVRYVPGGKLVHISRSHVVKVTVVLS